jgi:hypothetical protein
LYLIGWAKPTTLSEHGCAFRRIPAGIMRNPAKSDRQEPNGEFQTPEYNSSNLDFGAFW